MTAKLHVFKAGPDWLGLFYALFVVNNRIRGGSVGLFSGNRYFFIPKILAQLCYK